MMFIKRVLAIAGLAVRTAVRLRLFIVLLLFLFIVIAGLPLAIKGDGTLRGQVVLLLYYSLGICGLILGVSAIWTSCWSISREIDEKQIQMIVVKPVYRIEVWLGKWLGLIFMYAVLLCISGCAIYLTVMLKVKYSGAGVREREVLFAEVLNSRRRVVPEAEDLSGPAHELMEKLQAVGAIPADLSHGEAYEMAYKQLLGQRAVVVPGSSRQWIFDLAEVDVPDKSSYMVLRYRLSMYARERNPVSGVWEAGTPENKSLHSFEIANYLEGGHVFKIPASIIDRGGKLVVTFNNADRDQSNIAVFNIENDVELFVHEGSFVLNYAKSVIIIFCNLALLLALGLTAGALFSFPTASFAVIAMIVVSMLAHYFAIMSSGGAVSSGCGHDHGSHHAWIEEATGAVAVKLNTVLDPAWKYAPLDRLTDAIMIEWREVGAAVLVVGLIYPGIFGCICGYFLGKRELALPV